MSNRGSDGVFRTVRLDRNEVIEIIDEVESELEKEDFTFASREQVLEGSFQRLRDRINSGDRP